MSDHSRNSGAAIAIAGNVVIDEHEREDQELALEAQARERVGAERADDERQRSS